MALTMVVTVTVNQQELDKLNLKARRQGRAERSARDLVEAAVSDALRHNWVVESATVQVQERSHP